MKLIISYLLLILFGLVVLFASTTLATAVSEVAEDHMLPHLPNNVELSDPVNCSLISLALYAVSYGGFFFLFKIAPNTFFSQTAGYAELCSYGFTIQLIVGIVFFAGLFRSTNHPANELVSLFGVAMLVFPWLIRQVFKRTAEKN